MQGGRGGRVVSSTLGRWIFFRMSSYADIGKGDGQRIVKKVGHLNGDALDCRRCNLTPGQHRQAGVAGVCSRPGGRRHAVQISCNGVRLVLGDYGAKQDAQRVYEMAWDWIDNAVVPPTTELGNKVRQRLEGLCIDLVKGCWSKTYKGN